MVLDLALGSGDAILSGLTCAISVATPFYGYGGQLLRWFEGEPLLNYLGKRQVIETISSFSGCYALLYLDRQTYQRNREKFAQDAYPLADYPSKDRMQPQQDVDPYDPGPDRYPIDTDGFSLSFLRAGANVYRRLADEPGPFDDKFYNIQGVQTTNQTVGGITWASLPDGYTPGSDGFHPISGNPTLVAGDDTQPAWSTRLLRLPESHWIRVEGDIDHMFMMEFGKTQENSGKLLGITTPPGKPLPPWWKPPQPRRHTSSSRGFTPKVRQLWSAL